MDNSSGIQIPVGLLPAVTEFNRGELVMIFVHPHADKDTVQAHLDLLEKTWEDSNDVTFIRQVDESLVSGDVDRGQMRELRLKAEDCQQVIVVVRRFQPRFSVAAMEADIGFHLLPGANGVNFELGKLRRLNAIHAGRIMSLPLHQARVVADFDFQSDAGESNIAVKFNAPAPPIRTISSQPD